MQGGWRLGSIPSVRTIIENEGATPMSTNPYVVMRTMAKNDWKGQASPIIPCQASRIVVLRKTIWNRIRDRDHIEVHSQPE